MIYAAFTFYLILVILAGLGVYRLWTRLARPGWVNWALLPGTIVSEMSYIFGCLITGGEIRRARLLPQRQADSPTDGEPTAETTGGVKYVGPIVAALASIVAAGATILAIGALLGKPVMDEFTTGWWLAASSSSLPQKLPTGWDEMWQHVSRQVAMLRRLCETLGRADWLDWRVPLFVYLSLCLSIRLSPVSRPVRPTLAAAAVIALVVAAIGLAWPRFDGLMQDIWPLLTYIWACLLLMLVATGLGLGIVALVRILAGKEAT